ncbi:hypothetical protein CVT26_010456 [Gymnopilus dilepis]|uniref:Peptidase C14 caspase domain-containing protein n=1 Tax=Gymnopilus dilepis TaxID=231916 RepID=A0A409Y0H2_9AGAR|nr:hypothetical protein CVT26_010456 [Gymnopilus dilepis]
MAIKPISPLRLQHLLQDAKAAIGRLSSGSESNEVAVDSCNAQEAHGFDNYASKFMNRIHEVTARYRGGTDGTGPSHMMDERKINELEDALWAAYGLTGEIIPDELLKECQRRLREACPGSRIEMSLKEELEILDAIHRYRKSRSTDAFRHYPGGQWTHAQVIPPQAEMQFKGRRFWALIIGNNAYPRAPLGGCINDAALIRRHIMDYLGVPTDHITFLTDASRTQIVNAFYDLRDSTRIQKGDNVLVHFSGHGSSYDPREYFTSTPSRAGSIEALCPIDRGPSVPDISDRELNIIFSEIGAEKGHNITFILDCCHSAGAVRSLISADTVRFMPPLRTGFPALDLQEMLEAADRNPRRRTTSPLATTENWEADITSFVTLAACHDYQLAEEFNTNSSRIDVRVRGFVEADDDDDGGEQEILQFSQFSPRGPMKPTVGGKLKPSLSGKADQVPAQTPIRHGRFTWALIKILQSKQTNKLTYESVIRSIGSLGPLQQPVVVGSGKSSKLWFGDV